MSEELHWDNSKVNENLLAENKALKQKNELLGNEIKKLQEKFDEEHLKLTNSAWYKISEENKQLRKYLARGGFIKDRNGKWCKEGDVVNVEKAAIGFAELRWDSDLMSFKFFNEDIGCGFDYDEVGYFELVEPCEPDICKDFEEVEK